jgi:hypothetical protein
LDWHHVDSYFRPNAIGRYSFDDQNNIAFNKFDKGFDLAITMDCSQCPVHPQLKPIFTEQTARFAETVRKHDAEPVFFRSWAYADKPEMTAQLTEQYSLPSNAIHALVIPAGLAFARSIEKPPDLNLYAPGKRHPSLLGTYLAASIVFAALYDNRQSGTATRRVSSLRSLASCRPSPGHGAEILWRRYNELGEHREIVRSDQDPRIRRSGRAATCARSISTRRSCRRGGQPGFSHPIH